MRGRLAPGAGGAGSSAVTPGGCARGRILCLGTWRSLEQALASPRFVSSPGVSPARVSAVPTLEDLERHLTDTAHPTLVLSRLFWPGGDALEAARLLGRQGFAGAYRAVAPLLPRPDIVHLEVMRVAPGLDFELVVPDPVALRPKNAALRDAPPLPPRT